MIVTPSANGKFTVTLQGDLYDPTTVAVYTRSKTMLRVKVEDPSLQHLNLVQLSFNATGISKTVLYWTDTKGVLEIPLHNIVNQIKNQGGSSVTLSILPKETDGTAIDATLVAPLVIFEGISYYDIAAPSNKEMEGFPYNTHYHRFILPPNVIINPQTFGEGNAPGIIIESNYKTNDDRWTWSQASGLVSSPITPTGERLNQLQCLPGSDFIWLSDGQTNRSRKWEFERPDGCADLVCIRWKSQTGALRQHFFPIVNFMLGSDKSVSLITGGDGYNVRKNPYEGVRCRLCSLTSYGYWYYMDLVQASEVHAVIQPTQGAVNWETEIASEITRAWVETDALETPQGIGFYNFEFTLKFRHYDSF